VSDLLHRGAVGVKLVRMRNIALHPLQARKGAVILGGMAHFLLHDALPVLVGLGLLWVLIRIKWG
jgi:hypothetical protein